MNSCQTHEAKADGKMSGLEETLRAYELNPFGQVDIETLKKPWPEGTQSGENENDLTAVIGPLYLGREGIVDVGAVSN